MASKTLSRSFPLPGAAVERVVGGILRKGGRVLLCLRNRRREHYPGVWDLPGGHVGDDETSQAALARELAEELGIDAHVPAGAPWRTFAFAAIEFSVFVIDAWEGDIRNCAPDEHEELRWCSVAELGRLDLAHPLYRTVLAQALEA